MTVQLSTTYTDPGRYNTHHYRQTGEQSIVLTANRVRSANNYVYAAIILAQPHKSSLAHLMNAANLQTKLSRITGLNADIH